MADTAQSVVAMAAWFHDAAARVHPALRNLRELQPGFPSTTPGSGSVGGGSGGGDSIVERLALTDGIENDDALRDLARIRTLVRELSPKVSELRDLTSRWGYRTAGEYNPGAPSPRPAGDSEAASNRDRWCSSCERIKVAEPVGPKGRNGRCRWCDDFVNERGDLPPLSILDARHRGIRITEAMLRDHTPAAARSKKKRKKGARR